MGNPVAGTAEYNWWTTNNPQDGSGGGGSGGSVKFESDGPVVYVAPPPFANSD
jgi:hypothetical protein